jgi:eukaryotic-like serine/threonine-protein kinase
MLCLSEETALDLAQGMLATQLRAPALEHLDACTDCRALVAALTKRSPPDAALSGDPTALSGMHLRGPLDALTPGARLGRYVVEKYLGCGGMGVVYAARDPELDRRVAVKLLRAASREREDPTESRGRLMREAQALARLSHPNVVAIYDVGTAGDRVFIAMELVDGVTLGAWGRTRQRSWREVAQVFSDAGRGLAAAHAAGLVHRDFKQSNVMIGADGRVRVMDFSLARAAVDSQAPSAPFRDESPLASPFTQSGALVGTPAYMAPEQFEGEVADARTDQFNFCVALYEALYGKRPFVGRTVDELAQQVRSGAVSAPPAGAGVPRGLRALLLRGLAVAPRDRFATMDALCAELDRCRRGLSRRLLPLAGGALVLVAVAAWAHAARQARICAGGEALAASAWGPEQQARAQKAFAATHLAGAQTSFERVASSLGAYARAWATMYTEACEATRVRGSQSDEALAARMACLEDSRTELAAFAEALTRADGALVGRAPGAGLELAPLEACADVKALLAPARPPGDVRVQAALFEVCQTLARARALGLEGKTEEAVHVLQGAAPLAHSLGHKPLEAEALSLLGWMESQAGDSSSGAGHLEQAALMAEASRNDREAALALVRLVRVEGVGEGRSGDAAALALRARAALERLGGDTGLEAQLRDNIAAATRRRDELANTPR